MYTVYFESGVPGPSPRVLIIHRPLGDPLGALPVPDRPDPAPGLVRITVHSPGEGGALHGH